MSQRFFVERPIQTDHAVLEGQEAQHLSKVMRAKVGDEVTLFDGSGAEFPARIARLGRAEVELSVLARREIDRELSRRVTLAVALPKGDRQRWLVEKLVELGVSELVPLVTQRSVAQPSGSALDRLRRAVIEASKQCGRNRLMAVAESRQLGTHLSEHSANALRLIAHPLDGNISLLTANWVSATGDVSIAIGPEGGFSPEEFALALEHEWRPVALGPRILRTETAAVAMAACCMSAELSGIS